MFAKHFLLVPLILACLQLSSIATAQTFITAWGSYGSGDGQFKTPESIAVGGSGSVYVTDGANDRVQVFTGTGAHLKTMYLGVPGQVFIAVDSNDNIYLTGYGQGVYKFTSTGTYVDRWGGFGSGPGDFSRAWAVAVDAQDNVYVIDKTSPNRIEVFTSSGTFLRQWYFVGDDTGNLDGLAIDASGNVFVACNDGGSAGFIRKYASGDTLPAEWRGGAPDGRFLPIRVAIGPEGHVYVVDGFARIQVFTSDGAFVTMWGSRGTANGQFDTATGIATDAFGGIYVTDRGNSRVQKFGSGPTPVQSVTWGSVKARYRGECGVAPSASPER